MRKPGQDGTNIFAFSAAAMIELPFPPQPRAGNCFLSDPRDSRFTGNLAQRRHEFEFCRMQG
jgi:hypothetical protein